MTNFVHVCTQWTLCSETILINMHQNWGKMVDFLRKRQLRISLSYPVVVAIGTIWKLFYILCTAANTFVSLWSVFLLLYLFFFIRIISPIVNCCFAYSHFKEPRRLPLRCHSHSSLPTQVLRLHLSSQLSLVLSIRYSASLQHGWG